MGGGHSTHLATLTGALLGYGKDWLAQDNVTEWDSSLVSQ